ncbi:T9SS type B sorting domain-containing protein [Flavobacteriaceae bacterium TP-CH-4]|uniref:T9SS type B sorting domain-containing protein n=1 Tax=Pelagihabitans pacificus TaxID=2696054 RepID=A0A967E3Y8_9FLAO|nr:T9SS type B sorting domain-containing protein [Pelagihabitans pacificus]NHF57842.1 T9SS type B sorting domain-containing protein [Pelagihabitans pacificus]
MKRELLLIALVLLVLAGYGQDCTNLTSPIPGDENVLVESDISWEPVDGVNGYLISIGETPGGTEWADRISVGNATTYSPPVGLPENRTLYITITLFFFNRPDIDCALGSFSTEEVLVAPGCATINTPMDNAIDVNQEAIISWEYVPKATGYSINIGTTQGGGEIVPTQDVGNVTSFDPPGNLPLEEEIFVQIIPRNENGPAPVICPTFSFMTGEMVELPGCSRLITPFNGETNVPLTPDLSWEEVPDAIGYRLFIGTSPFENNVVSGAVYSTNQITVIDFEANSTIYVTIVPFNAGGDAIGCLQESFSTIQGCGPFFDGNTNELVQDLRPELEFPNSFRVCSNDLPTVLSTDAVADQFRWVRLSPNDGSELELLSNSDQVTLTQEGRYRLEAINFSDPDGANTACPTQQDFVLEIVAPPTINSIDSQTGNESVQLTVNASGSGDYEYALNNVDGPYQDSNVFNNVPSGNNMVYVRDKDLGCVVSANSLQYALSEAFPNFFTPNGDGVHDFWQFSPPPEIGEIAIETIYLFDRMGNFIIQLNPDDRGWDGNLNGTPLPSSDYWYKAIFEDQDQIQGHFTLKR